MAKKKPGLHKKLSSIFDGVDVPGACDPGQAGSAPEASTGWGRPSEGSVPPAASPADAVTNASDVTPAADRTVSDGINSRSAPGEHVFGNSPARKQKTPVASAADRKEAVMKGLVGVLAVVFVTVIVIFYTPLLGHKPQTAAASEEVVTPAEALEDVEVAWDIPAAMGKLERDPMQRASAGGSSESGAGTDGLPAAQVDAIVVRGIMYSADNPAAIIGQDVVHPGETVFGVKVSRIMKKQVEFELNGKKWTQGVQGSQ